MCACVCEAHHRHRRQFDPMNDTAWRCGRWVVGARRQGGEDEAPRRRTKAQLAVDRLGRGLEGSGQRGLGIYDRLGLLRVLVDGRQLASSLVGRPFAPLDVLVAWIDDLQYPLRHAHQTGFRTPTAGVTKAAHLRTGQNCATHVHLLQVERLQVVPQGPVLRDLVTVGWLQQVRTGLVQLNAVRATADVHAAARIPCSGLRAGRPLLLDAVHVPADGRTHGQ